MNPANDVRVCLRLDDYTAETPIEVVQALAAILERHRSTCLFAVIPFRLTGAAGALEPLAGPMADVLAQLVARGLVVPALHGFVHRRTPDGLEEFASGTVAEQAAKIAQGKAHLERILGSPILGFVPPWNVVSDATEAALQGLGFSYVSTAIDLEHTSRWDLVDIPGTCYWSARSGVLNGLDHLNLSPIVVFTGHFYDFHHPSGELRRDALDEFDRTLAWLRDLEHVQVVGMDDVASACARDRSTWKRITRCRAAFDMPFQVRRAVTWPKWLPTSRVSKDLRRVQMLGLGIWSSIVLGFFLAGWAVGNTGLVSMDSPYALVLAVLGGVMVVVAMRRGFARQLTRAALLAVAGCVLGLSSSGCLYR